jgi:predicted dehydrogenase
MCWKAPDTMTNSLGLLLLSCVRHQGTYAPLFAAQDGVQIVAVADEPDIPEWMHAVNQEFADRYQTPYLRDVEAALARPDVDIVSICSEPTRHARLAVLAAQAGKQICVDKPMATTVADAERVVAAVEAAGVTFTYIHRLYSPAIQKLRAALDAGAVGLPFALHMSWVSAGGLTSGAVEDFQLVVDRRLSGGGELMNFLGYHLDTARYLTGLEIEEVYASAGNYYFEPHREHGVEDFGLVCLTLERGVSATIIAGRSPTKAHTASGDYQLRVHGSQGTLVADETRPYLSIFADPSGRRSQPSFAVAQALLEPVIGDFLDCVRNGGQPLRSVHDGRGQIAAIEAAYRSLESGQVERVWRQQARKERMHASGYI